jgi:hypothetical protein
MRGGQRPLATEAVRDPTLTHPGLTGRGRTRPRVGAWPCFLNIPRTQATFCHATHPTADAGLLRLCFPERRKNLYTSRAIPVWSCPHPSSPVITCLRTGNITGQGRAAANTLEQRRNDTNTVSFLIQPNTTKKMPLLIPT